MSEGISTDRRNELANLIENGAATQEEAREAAELLRISIAIDMNREYVTIPEQPGDVFMLIRQDEALTLINVSRQLQRQIDALRRLSKPLMRETDAQRLQKETIERLNRINQ